METCSHIIISIFTDFEAVLILHSEQHPKPVEQDNPISETLYYI